MNDFKFPFALDKSTGKASITLFFAYLSFWQTFIFVTIASFVNYEMALIASFFLLIICLYFYRARGIDKIKAGRDGFEISNDTSNDDEEEITDKTNKKTEDQVDEEQPEGWGNASGKST